MKWFNNPETLEDLKKQYKKLAFQNHPDRGGKTSEKKSGLKRMRNMSTKPGRSQPGCGRSTSSFLIRTNMH